MVKSGFVNLCSLKSLFLEHSVRVGTIIGNELVRVAKALLIKADSLFFVFFFMCRWEPSNLVGKATVFRHYKLRFH